MAEDTKTEGAAPEQPQVKSRILAQYVRDMSFENILAQKGATGEVQPELDVKVNLDARKRPADNQYEVSIKLNITSNNKATKAPLFVLELDYAGIFHVEGLPDEQLHPYLLIECPRMIFPFARRVISDVTRDGGFPPVNLEQLDFVGLYRQELARRMAEQKKQTEKAN